jgi:hypothetical protein
MLNSVVDYFPLLDSTNSQYNTPYRPYYFLNKNSKNLVVTVGASWTWGNGVPKLFDFEVDNFEVDIAEHKFRQRNIYGALVADAVSADFLNLAANGSSNFFSASRISELLDYTELLDQYEKIYLIWVATDPGKGFNSHEDMDVDYYNFLKDNTDLNSLLAFMNTTAINQFWNKLKQNKKIIFRFGTDWVDAIGSEVFDSYRISTKPWLLSLKETANINPEPCYICEKFALENLIKHLPEFGVDSSISKLWMVDNIERSTQRYSITGHKNLGDLFIKDHPTILAHKQWADLVLNSL